MSDGTVMAVQYSVPVHYYDNENYVDFNNTLVEVDAEETQTTQTEENENALMQLVSTLTSAVEKASNKELTKDQSGDGSMIE